MINEKFTDFIVFEDDLGRIRRLYCQVLEENQAYIKILIFSGKILLIPMHKIAKVKLGVQS